MNASSSMDGGTSTTTTSGVSKGANHTILLVVAFLIGIGLYYILFKNNNVGNKANRIEEMNMKMKLAREKRLQEIEKEMEINKAKMKAEKEKEKDKQKEDNDANKKKKLTLNTNTEFNHFRDVGNYYRPSVKNRYKNMTSS